jgi:starch synthase
LTGEAGAPLRIGFVAAELAPFAKRGGLGDVAAALTRHLAAEGHDVRTFVPLYGAGRRPEGMATLSDARDVPVALGPHTFTFTARTAPLPGHAAARGGPRVVLVDCPEVFGGDVYEGDTRDALRFAVFCRAVLETCQRLAWAPQVFHVHDWHASLVPLLLRSAYARDRLFASTRTLLTLHNVGFQGVVGAERLAELGLAGAAEVLPADDLAAGRVNLLKAAILEADLLSTVSPTHAREITTPEGGAGLDGVLRRRADRLAGIVNGIDVEEWDPATDPHLPARFAAGDLLGKAACRRELAAELGLDYEPAAPVAGIVSRLTWQKGFDLAFETLPAVLAASDLRLAVLGTGEERYERFFAGLERAFPGRVAFRRAFSEPLAHRIEAGSDVFLMPSRYEPCGLNQMYSQRYGTLPVVRRTGGLADTVEPYDPARPEAGGTGFVFDHFTADGFRWALELALATWRDRPRWRRLIDRAMSRDFSWHRRGAEYVALYRRLAGEGR